MIAQSIKAFLLFFSVVFTIFSIEAWLTSDKAFSGLIVLAFILLLASNIVDLFDNWQVERRKQDWWIEERTPWILKRQAD